MDDLRVESYDEKEVAAKKRSTLKRVAVAGGAIVLILGLFGILRGCDDNTHTTGGGTLPYYYNGGSGSWFTSVLERM